MAIENRGKRNIRRGGRLVARHYSIMLGWTLCTTPRGYFVALTDGLDTRHSVTRAEAARFLRMVRNQWASEYADYAASVTED